MDEILINAQAGETRIALVDQGILRDIIIARPDSGTITGHVFLGRVERVLPGIQAAFVEIGLESAGFLALPEARPPAKRESPGDDSIIDYVSRGDAVLVQVLRDSFDDKGAKLTTHVSLAGRMLVLAPGQPGVKLSRRIDGDQERSRLSSLIEDLIQNDEGIIVRTVAVGASQEDLERDVAFLRATWDEIRAKRDDAHAPACLHRDLDPIHRVLRDEGGSSTRRIAVDDGTVFSDLRRFCQRFAPDMAERIEHHRGARGLFEDAGIEEQLETALATAVALESGGSLLFAETAALTAIDVNTGGGSGSGPRDTALRTNLEAAGEIARQIRLRNISGLLVVDFVSMKQREDNARVLAALRAAVADDPTPTQVFGFTRLGLVEMTRQRRHGSLLRTVGEPCPVCEATGWARSPASIAFQALRAVRAEAAATPGSPLILCAAPAVIDALHGLAKAALTDIENRLGQPLTLEADRGRAVEHFDIRRAPRHSEMGNG